MKYIKEYGLKRTGTKFFKLVMELNFEDLTVLDNILGYKHGPIIYNIDHTGETWCNNLNIKDWRNCTQCENIDLSDVFTQWEKRKIKIITLFKNPYLWISSLNNYYSYNKERILTNKETYTSLYLWNKVNLYYIKNNVYHLDFEELICKFHFVMNDIKYYFNLFQKYENYINLSHYMSIDEKKNVEFDYNYYRQKEYLNYLNDDQFKIINNYSDKKVMSYMGFIHERKNLCQI